MARCIALLGPSQSGKSTLLDHLVGLEEGWTADAAPGEIRVGRFSYGGERWTALDCPGSIEFLQRSHDALLAADAAVIVVPSDPEAAALAAPAIRAVEAAGTPALIFVNKIDDPRGRMRDVVAGLQQYASHVLILRQIPIREGDAVVGAVDLVSERAWRYREGERSQLVRIPAATLDREHDARDEMLEHLSDFDDRLLEEIVEDHAPAEGAVYSICARVLAENRAIPVLIGSAGRGNGIARLMKALRHEAPGVETLRARLGGGAAIAFAARQRRHVGRVVLLRALEDGLKTGARLGGGGLGALGDAASDNPAAIGAVEAGDLAAAVKSDHLETGRPLSAEEALPPPPWLRAAPGQESRILRPAQERDEAKLSAALARIAMDDRALDAGPDPETGAQRVDVSGPLHLRALLDQLNGVFGVEAVEAPVAPSWRETIAASVEKHHRHRKQSGGSGQYADIRLIVEPAPRGAGFVFEERVKGGAVPRNYIPAVEAGAREALAKGPLGFPVLDVRVTLTDGQHHSVDSSDMAFRIAARQGVAEALAEAHPVLLQPMLEVRLHAPTAHTGALQSVVTGARGHVLGFDRDGSAAGWDLFRALLPGSALGDFAAHLRAATQGLGWFEAAFDHYEELYGKEAERISLEYGGGV